MLILGDRRVSFWYDVHMAELFGLLSGIIAVYASIPYILDIIKGNTKPQRAAWVIFVTLSAISFFAQLAAGATNSLWFPLVLLIQAVIIFGLSFKYGMGGFSKFDLASLFMAAIILIIWWLTSSAELAIICGVVVNTIGKILVGAKVYNHPNTEYLPTWAWSVVASVFSILAVGSFDWILILTPLQNAITVGMIALLIVYRRKAVVN